MSASESTCWTVIKAAAAGGAEDRAVFARCYGPVIRSYLAARWRSSLLASELEDATQEVFLACFEQNGVLDRAQRERGFRPFLYGVVRNVARHFEQSRLRRRENAATDSELAAVPADEASLSHAFDRAWAQGMVREAARLMEVKARRLNEAACRRVELLRLRFHEGMPIRDIADRWKVDAALLHHEYAKARQEFRMSLTEIVGLHHPASPAEIERECINLLSLLE